MFCRLGRRQRAALEIFAIGDQDQNFIAAGSSPQRRLRFVNGAGNVGAATRYGVGVDGAQSLVKRAVVQGEGTHQKGTAGECHYAHRIAVQLIREVVNC